MSDSDRSFDRSVARASNHLAIVLIILLVSSSARSAVVFPPGQEDLLAEMFGSRASAALNCTFTGGQVEAATLTAKYDCPTGAVVLKIGHSASAPPGALRTKKFSIAVEEGTAPPGFLAAVELRVRSREPAFAWMSVQRPPFPEIAIMAPTDPFLDAILVRAVVLLPAATGVVGLMLLGRMVLNHRRRPPTHR